MLLITTVGQQTMNTESIVLESHAGFSEVLAVLYVSEHGQRRLNTVDAELIYFSNCSVFPLNLSDLGTNPSLDDTFCLQWCVFMSVRSRLLYEELAATPHRAEQVRSGTKWVVQGGIGTVSGLCF